MTTPQTKMHRCGILLVLIAATAWGASGTVTQFLFHTQHLSPEWLVTVRMLLAGTLLLLPQAWQDIRGIFD
ncbi:MAG: EamA family transporter, partial [Selenomonadales bacterium]|nr:EamA family transporter [Selenomonadales bacterium]